MAEKMIFKTKFKETEIGMIPEDWEVKKAGDIAKFQYGLGESAEKEGEFVYIRITDINLDGTLNKSGLVYIKKNKVKENVILKKGDVLVARTGATYGKTYLFKENFNATYGGFLIKFLFDKKIIDNNFFFQFSRSKNYWNQANNLVGGGAQPQFNANVILELKIPLPSISEQSAITKILSDLDSKIELNCQMNKTLEAIGQAIFKSWFVDFEFPNEKGKPYKSSGGEMVDSEFGDIPRGWQVDNVTKLFTLEYGWHLPEWDRQEGDVPVFGSGGLTGYHNSHFVEGPGVIIGRAGKVGPESVYYSHLNFCPIETTFYVLAENKRIIRYLYFFLKTLETVNTGSSVPNLSRRDIHSAKIIIPGVKEIESFDKIVKTLFDQIKNSEKEIDYLSQIHDSLLPRLMSGKIRVGVESEA